MADTFPTGLFGFMLSSIDIEGSVLDGGEALAGGVDRIATDGGGRVVAEFSEGSLVDRETVLAWRAVVAGLDQGVTAVVVPFCDTRHAPYGNSHAVTYGDGAYHADGTPFSGGGPFAETTAAAGLRATTLAFTGVFARPLLGGEWFTVDHPTKGPRAYRLTKVDETNGTLAFRPPLREAVPDGTVLDFSNPRCLMAQDGRAPMGLQYKRQTTAQIRFVEIR